MRRILSTVLMICGLAAILSAGDDNRRFTVQFNPGRINWNPHYAYTTTEAQIFTALHEGLVVFHPATLQPVPGAAESWDLSEDDTTFVFHIRENASWSNGRDLTATDFRDSWMALLSPETGAEYASLLDDIVGAREYRTGVGPAEDVEIEAVSDKVLTVHLKAPSPHFISILCHYSFAPVYPDFRSTADWSAIRSVPVNGPFIIRARSSEEMLLDPNPYYHSPEAVGLDGLRLMFLDDPGEVMDRFNSFEIDWIVSGMDTTMLAIPEALSISPLFSTTYYYFSSRKGPWADPRIRRALIMLMPMDEIRNNRFIPATTLVPPIPNYPEAGPEFPEAGPARLEEAMALLEEAGYPGGHGLPELVIRVPLEDDVTAAMEQAWEESLEMEVRIEIVEYPGYYESVKAGGYDVATLTWTGDYADPYTFLGMWNSHSSFNESGFNDPEFDSLLIESATLPFLERYSLLKEAEDILLSGSQVLPVEHFPSVNLIDRRFVGGWYPNALDIHPFRDLVPEYGTYIPGLAMR